MCECGECEATFHEDCREASARCPTLGCVADPPRLEAARRNVPSAGKQWPAGALAAAAIVWVAIIGAFTPNHPDRLEQFTATVAGLYGLFFLARTAIAGIRRERGTAWRIHLAIALTAPAWAAALGWAILLLARGPLMLP
jgi:hypothetical protein